MSELLAGTAPATRRVRAYFAPLDRATGTPSVWDAAGIAGFALDAPPAPWVDLGWCTGFERASGTKVEPLLTGTPATAAGQVRTAVEATVGLAFESWGKLQMALSAGVQQMNVLATAAGAAANGSGGAGVTAVALGAGSTATALEVGDAAAAFSVGDVVAVDVDYTGQTGFVGSGVSGGYVRAAAAIRGDTDYVRRVTLNVARVTAIGADVLMLGAALPAGVPTAGMRVSRVAAFCDREGASFFQEWSGLFVLEGAQGDRVVFHYPRLQAMAGAAELAESVAATRSLGARGANQTHGSTAGTKRTTHAGVQHKAHGATDGRTLVWLRLAGRFRALPVRDANDGELVVCYRSYLPAAMRTV